MDSCLQLHSAGFDAADAEPLTLAHSFHFILRAACRHAPIEGGAQNPGSQLVLGSSFRSFCSSCRCWGCKGLAVHALVQGGGKPQRAAAVLGQVEVQPASVGADLEPHLHRVWGSGSDILTILFVWPGWSVLWGRRLQLVVCRLRMAPCVLQLIFVLQGSLHTRIMAPSCV